MGGYRPSMSVVRKVISVSSSPRRLGSGPLVGHGGPGMGVFIDVLSEVLWSDMMCGAQRGASRGHIFEDR
jgi:hypothetical protein